MATTYAPGSTLSVQDVANLIDHALLKPELTPAEVEQSCRELAQHEIWSVCVRPSDVALPLPLASGTAASRSKGLRIAPPTTIVRPLV